MSSLPLSMPSHSPRRGWVAALVLVALALVGVVAAGADRQALTLGMLVLGATVLRLVVRARSRGARS